MSEAVTHSQRLSITLRHLATGNNSEEMKFITDYSSINWNYRAGDVFTARLTDPGGMDTA
jgi:hypothetical protein